MTKENSSETTSTHPKWLNEDIFIEFVKNIFKNLKKIEHFEVAPAVASGENYLTLVLRVKIIVALKDATETEISFITKVLPKNKELRDNVKEWKLFLKENNTYKIYIPEFEKMYRKMGKEISFGPKIYESIKLNNNKDEVLIMEDLNMSGFENVKRQIGFDMMHTKTVLEKLAQFHAASACYYELFGPYPDMYDSNLCSKSDEFVEYRANTAKLVCESLKLCGIDHLKNDLESYTSQAPDMFQLRERREDPNEFRVLNHGDAWVNNIMFQYDEMGGISEMYFVDLQMSRYSSPAQDLYYLLLSSVSLDLKIKYFDYFVHFYHTKLIENLKLLNYTMKMPSLKDLHTSLIRHGDWAYTVTTSIFPRILMDPYDNVKTDSLTEDEDEQPLYNNPRYLMHIKEIYPWAHNRGLFEYRST